MRKSVLAGLAGLEHFPEAAGDAADGKYVISTDSPLSVGSFDEKVQHDNWFKTPPLDEQTIERLHSLQLFTESHDQGYCSDRAAGIWTWFELAIMKDANAKDPRVKDGIELVWTTHRNVQGEQELAELEGGKFDQRHDIFRLIEKGNVLVIRLCSRFAGWYITANRGILVIELGPPMERDELGFPRLKKNLISTQNAFKQVNEALFPDQKEIAILPDDLFRAENLATATGEKRPLRVLSLDGGGVRGVSSLMILQKIMEDAFPNQKKKPCEVFDLIAGTSTGGLIAIMLGCLEMDVETCIEKYDEYMKEIFPSPGKTQTKWIPAVGRIYDWISDKAAGATNFGKAAVGIEMRDHRVLEKKIKHLIGEQLGVEDPENVLLYDPDKRDPKCKVFVTAVRTDDVSNGVPVLLRSYHSNYAMPAVPRIKLWEAARATSAAPVYFEPLTVSYMEGNEAKTVTFVDGGVQANNPVGWLWNEVVQRFSPKRETDCFLSIGTGRGLGASLPSFSALNAKSFTGGVISLLTNTESTNVLFRVLIDLLSPVTTNRKYWRFDCGDGLPDFFVDEDGVGTWRLVTKTEEHDLGGMDNVDMVPFMKELTTKYMAQKAFTNLSDECCEALNPKKKN